MLAITTVISNLHDSPAGRCCPCFIAEETEAYGIKPGSSRSQNE